MELILASNSPRRRYLLGFMGWDFQVIPADVDERILPGEAPADYVLRLAQSKARTVGAQIERDAVIVSADTTVVDGDDIIGKPLDCEDAERMLRRLRGRVHQVYTAVAALRSGENEILVELATTDVPMRQYSDEEIREYISSGDPLDKAGAYAIQHAGFHPVEDLQGCYANVVGLPLCHLTRMLIKMGTGSSPFGGGSRWGSERLPDICLSALEYQCPIYKPILRKNL